jgi:hypothetical protein
MNSPGEAFAFKALGRRPGLGMPCTHGAKPVVPRIPNLEIINRIDMPTVHVVY